MTTTFSKLQNGSWGIKGDAATVRSGRQVPVSKRDGTVETVTVDRVVWTGSGTSIASIVATRPATPTRRPATNRGGAAAQVAGYPKWCTGRDNCRCFDCI